VRGPNIKPVPTPTAPQDELRGTLLLKMGDNITTDHIMPAGARVLPLRSNIPAISEFTLARVDPTFPARAKAAGGGFLAGGANYGQGSSREHAAIGVMFLGVKAVIAKSFARIHLANLINFGVLPVTFAAPADIDRVSPGDELAIESLRERLAADALRLRLCATGEELPLKAGLTPRQSAVYLAGGLLNRTREMASQAAAAPTASR